MHNLCGKLDACKDCDPEVKATIERELSELKLKREVLS